LVEKGRGASKETRERRREEGGVDVELASFGGCSGDFGEDLGQEQVFQYSAE